MSTRLPFLDASVSRLLGYSSGPLHTVSGLHGYFTRMSGWLYTGEDRLVLVNVLSVQELSVLHELSGDTFHRRHCRVGKKLNIGTGRLVLLKDRSVAVCQSLATEVLVFATKLEVNSLVHDTREDFDNFLDPDRSEYEYPLSVVQGVLIMFRVLLVAPSISDLFASTIDVNVFEDRLLYSTLSDLFPNTECDILEHLPALSLDAILLLSLRLSCSDIILFTLYVF